MSWNAGLIVTKEGPVRDIGRSNSGYFGSVNPMPWGKQNTLVGGPSLDGRDNMSVGWRNIN